MKRYKNLKKLLLAVVLFIFVIIMVFVISYKNAIEKPLNSNESTMLIEVKQGEGFYDILNKLDKEDKLSNKLLIKVKLAIDKKNIKLREGIYEINTSSSLEELISSLENKSGIKSLIKFTIPEGYSIEEIGTVLEEKEICSKEEFIKAVQNYDLPKYVNNSKKKRYNLEGFLYPDTYFVEEGLGAENIVKIMLNRFEDVLNQVKDETKVDIKDEDVEKIITIASMIEKEAKVQKDRPLISSVIYNRLDKNMKLEIDAAVIYALGYHVDVVLNKHLEINSPYNVYKYEGLPAGPIASPGINCIKAAMVPEKTDYLYYILQKDNSHYFTNSYDDFLKKKKELGY